MAWIAGDAAFVVADSAMTTPGRRASERLSSFGETQQHDDVAVEESALKLLRVSPHVLVALSGDTRACFAFAGELRRLLRTSPGDVVAACRSATDLLHGASGHVQALALGYMRGPLIVLCDNRGPSVETESNAGVAHVIGRLSEQYVSLLIADLRGLASMNLSPRLALSAFMACTQAVGLMNPLTTEGVGGAFWGGLVDVEGAHWADDQAYVVYRPPFGEVDRSGQNGMFAVLTFVRDNVRLVYSSGNNLWSMFATDAEHDEPWFADEAAREVFLARVLADHPWDGEVPFRYCALIGLQQGNVLFIDQRRRGSSPVILLRRAGRIHIEILTELGSLLEQRGELTGRPRFQLYREE